MSQVKATFSGGVVAEPVTKQVGSNTVLEFPVYVNHRRKVPNTSPAQYENTGDTTKIRVTLWRELAETDIRKGDIVEVVGSLVEKEWTKQDGTSGRGLQTEFVDSVEVKYRKDEGAAPAASAPKGFEDLGFL